MNDRREDNGKIKRFARTSVFSAVAVVLSFIEGVLPALPIPGAKPGLANLAVMASIDIDGLFGGICVSLIKSCFVLVTRGPTAGIMSLCGSMFSTFITWLILSFDKNKAGYVGIGVCGAVSHNMGQMCIARVIMGNTVKYYIPALLIMGVITGSVTGVINSILLPTLKKTERNSF